MVTEWSERRASLDHTHDLGHRNGVEAEVVKGLSEGTTVIVHPGDSIQNETRVEARTK